MRGADIPTNALEEPDSTRPIRVVIADDHSVVRRGSRQVLQAEGDLEVVAEAEDIAGARRYVRGHRPQVLMLDLNMPEGSSLEAVPEIRAECPDTRIVVLTMQDEPAYARQAVSAGALGYVLKDAADAELVEAVRRAAAGDRYLNPRLGARVAAEPARVGPGSGGTAAAHARVRGSSGNGAFAAVTVAVASGSAGFRLVQLSRCCHSPRKGGLAPHAASKAVLARRREG